MHFGKRPRRWLPTLAILLLATVLVAIPVSAQGPPGTLWWEQTDGIVYASATSADGEFLVFGTIEGLVEARDRDGAFLWQYDVARAVRAIDVTASGDRIVIAHEGRAVTCLDAEGQVVWEFATGMPPADVAISSDGAVVVVSEQLKGRFYLIDGRDGTQLWSQETPSRVQSVAVSSDGTRVYVGRYDARVLCYDVQTQDLLWETMLDRIIYALAVTADGERVYAGGSGNTVQALDAVSGEMLWRFPVSDRVTAIDVTGDGELVAASSWDKKVYLLSKEGEQRQLVQTADWVHTLSLDEDGVTLLVATDRNEVFVVGLAGARSAAATRARRLLYTTAAALALGITAYLVLRHWIRTSDRGAEWWEPKGRVIGHAARAFWSARIGYLFMIPTFALLIAFSYAPTALGLAYGFAEWTPGRGRAPRWVGLENFRKVLENPVIPLAIRNQLIIVLADLFKTLVGPLVVAELILGLRRARSQYLWRTLFIIPLVVPGVATTLMWRNIMDPNLGLINNTLFLLGLANPASPPTWLADRSLALGSLIFIGFPWIGAFPLLIFYGGLITISSDIFDAARVDGATGLQRVLRVDIPILVPQIRMLSVLAIIGSLQSFGLQLLTTQGGPAKATTTPAWEMYIQGIQASRWGYAAALAAMLFLVIMGLTLLNMRIIGGDAADR